MNLILKHCAILFAALAAGGAAFAQSTATAAATPRAAELKIGLVNTEKLLRESAPAQRAFKKLEREFATRQAEVDRKSTRLNSSHG